MSVFGVDFGNLNSTVAITRYGGVDIVTNEVSKRETTTIVSFVNDERFIGEQGLDRYVRNAQNTIFLLKRFIGMRIDDEDNLAQERRFLTCNVDGDETGRLRFCVDYCGETHRFYPEQVLAMMLQKLRSYVNDAATTDARFPADVRDCVITVPSYYTAEQRRLVYQAAEVAGLHCMSLINESAATAIDYGIFRGSSLKETEEEGQLVGIFDIGYGTTDLTVAKFWRGNCKVVCRAHDRHAGTRDLDYALFEHMAEEVRGRYKVDVSANRRARLRLLQACERLKYLLSANQSAPLNVENLMDIDVNIASFERATFEAVAAPVLARMRAVLERGLREAGVAASQLHSVEMIGGGCRIPAIKRLAEEVFGRSPSFTLNASETTARGAAITAAMLSPKFQVREFKLAELASYPLMLGYHVQAPKVPCSVPFLPEINKAVTLLAARDAYPRLLDVTIPRAPPFKIYAYYNYEHETVRETVSPSQYVVGEWGISSLSSKAAGGEAAASSSSDVREVRVRIHIKPDGLLYVEGATGIRVVEETATAEKASSTTTAATAAAEGKSGDKEEATTTAAPHEQAQATPSAADEATASGNGNNNNAAPTQAEGDKASGEGSNNNNNAAAAAAAAKTKKSSGTRHQYTDLAVTPNLDVLGHPSESVLRFCKHEREMHQRDTQIIRTREKKNELESYILNYRPRFAEGSGALAEYVTEDDRRTFLRTCDADEAWLYEDGEHASYEAYDDRVRALRVIGDAAHARQRNRDDVAFALTGYKSKVQAARTRALDAVGKQAHITEDELRAAAATADEALAWADREVDALMQRPKHENASLTPKDLEQRAQTVISGINTLLNRPPPPPPKPKAAPATPAAGAKTTDEQQQQQQPSSSSSAAAPTDGAAEATSAEAADAAAAAREESAEEKAADMAAHDHDAPPPAAKPGSLPERHEELD